MAARFFEKGGAKGVKKDPETTEIWASERTPWCTYRERRERDFLRSDSFFCIGGREVSDGQAQSEFGLDRISEFGPDRSPVAYLDLRLRI